jgi:hypothetical protein
VLTWTGSEQRGLGVPEGRPGGTRGGKRVPSAIHPPDGVQGIEHPVVAQMVCVGRKMHELGIVLVLIVVVTGLDGVVDVLGGGGKTLVVVTLGGGGCVIGGIGP